MPVATRQFQATVRQQAGIAVMDMSGEINSAADAALSAAFATALAHQPARVVLNFAAVEYINSTGIALIVGLLAQARQRHLPMGTVGLSDHYAEIFRITRLSDFMEMYPDESTALAG